MTGQVHAVTVPGDKSISHRALLIAALAPGSSTIRGLPEGRDVRNTASALAAMGVAIDWERDTGRAVVTPPSCWPVEPLHLDCGNSGTSARLLAGLTAGLGVPARIDGDHSLRSRPMDRVVYPLQAMGARIRYAAERDRLPIEMEARLSGSLRVLRYRARVSSAQVKSALVLAALADGVEFELWEPGRSRDHTERLLEHLGVPLSFGPGDAGSHLKLDAGGLSGLRTLDLRIPGDPSSAAFLITAAVLGGRRLRVDDVLLNPTRIGFLHMLEQMGVDVEIDPGDDRAGEPVGTVSVAGGLLRGVQIGAQHVPSLVDEIPLLAVLAVYADGVTAISGAGELRVKESDRLSVIAENLKALGASVEETPDGLLIEGTPDLVPRGTVRTLGDHRIAMAFACLSSISGSEIVTDDPECVAVSYPGFWEDCAAVGAGR